MTSFIIIIIISSSSSSSSCCISTYGSNCLSRGGSLKLMYQTPRYTQLLHDELEAIRDLERPMGTPLPPDECTVDLTQLLSANGK